MIIGAVSPMSFVIMLVLAFIIFIVIRRMKLSKKKSGK